MTDNDIEAHKMKPKAWQSSVDPAVVTADPNTAIVMQNPTPLYDITELKEKLRNLFEDINHYRSHEHLDELADEIKLMIESDNSSAEIGRGMG